MKKDLLDGEIHVWSASLDSPTSQMQSLAQLLSSDERARAEQFHFEADRNRFVVGRGLLRTILSQYVEVEPGQLQFHYGSHGKPALAASCGSQGLRFNLAHSHGLGLYAIVRNLEVGVDLEYVHTTFDVEAIAERFFTIQETAMLRTLPASQQRAAFFNGWTRKEAVLKAIGDGLAQPLDRMEVWLSPGEPARLLSVNGDRLEAQHWTLFDLSPAAGYVAAVAIRSRGVRLKCRHWVD